MMHSSLEIYNLETKATRIVYQTDSLIEAPNWGRDGKHLLVNGDGRLFSVPINGGKPAPIDTGFATKCNNDHGISPNGKQIAISDGTVSGQSTIYILPADGGAPTQVTPNNPSYWHGWSPDGTTLAFCGQRTGKFDIYTIPVNGGAETRLTNGEGHNDGPDYSADGTWIYFNSSRSGRNQIWRLHPDGAGVEQITNDGHADWFPHPSPDGKNVLLLSYDGDVDGHPRDKHVKLRLMNPDGTGIHTLFALFGGQGSINVPNWSPDGTEFAFVRYARLVV
jgi:Tol biopolymer transport system component